MFTHVGPDGSARMVDVSGKPVSVRDALAEGFIALQPRTLELIAADEIAKGDVLGTARLAGITATKRTSDLIPLCHTLLLDHAEVGFEPQADGIRITCRVRTIGRTGAEMEALTGVSLAALTIYDMCKAVDKTMVIRDVRLVSKTKTPCA
ncbi:MAG: cyclic pyranopterin monophosphate synthase MoaC [Verrucomicrobia bacterium]|nr:cyclic pyranopterin monophosphate synthase MoaC [Verrucomicrobiota bacterium]